jgi:2-amino-4-hydroxy-6-hydroxymethyldihydropteridine diphosphokinase
VTIAYLGLGSNLGDRKAYLRSALEGLGSLEGTSILAISGLYCSRPWGKIDQPEFANIAASIETALEPEELLGECKRLERKAGRTAGERWGPRVLDIDILLYENIALESAILTIPHPRMWQRRFVLMPLAELLPQLFDPSGRSIYEVLKSDEIAAQGVWPCGELESKGVDEDR